jgi:hypothetical protein
MKPLVLLALLSNLLLIFAFALAYSMPRLRPFARRFFRWLAWLNLTLWVAQAGACQFNLTPSGALQALTGVIIPSIEGILPLVAGTASLLLPADATLISTAQGLVAQGLAALEKLLQQYQANPNDKTLAALTDGFNDVHDNLKQLLQAAQVKNNATAAKITLIVNDAQQSLATMESALTAKHSATVAAAGQAPE